MELERALVAQTTEAEVLGRRVHELEARMVEQAKTMADRELEISRLNETVAAAHRTEIDLRSELASAANRGRSATEGLAKEKALIEDQLAQSKAERTKLQQEIAAMKREAEQTWAAERVENALLRERINDIAAEIARLTSEPAATHGQHPANGERKSAAGGEGKGNLADRIRALQLKASRLPAAT
jgi:chromosome segregation ATPase